MARRVATTVAITATWRERAKRSLISSVIGAPVHMERPRSSRTSPPIQSTNCLQIGWSRPSFRRSSAIIPASTNWPCPPAMNRASTTSPGTIRSSTKVSTATPRSVGTISRKRVAPNLHMGRSAAPPDPGPGCRSRGPTAGGQTATR
jgi:hypothetical protein